MRVRWTTMAADDLSHIVEYIRKDNPAAARRVAQTIYHRISELRRPLTLGVLAWRRTLASWCLRHGPTSRCMKSSKTRCRCFAYATQRKTGHSCRARLRISVGVRRGNAITGCYPSSSARLGCGSTSLAAATGTRYCPRGKAYGGVVTGEPPGFRLMRETPMVNGWSEVTDTNCCRSGSGCPLPIKGGWENKLARSALFAKSWLSVWEIVFPGEAGTCTLATGVRLSPDVATLYPS
jgi:hypothetical protein